VSLNHLGISPNAIDVLTVLDDMKLLAQYMLQLSVYLFITIWTAIEIDQLILVWYTRYLLNILQ